MHKSRLLFTRILITPLLLSGCAAPWHSPDFEPVQPGYLFRGDYINVQAPKSPGWHLRTSSSSGMEFARSGERSIESFGAQVLIFALPKMQGKEEFLSHIKSGIQKDTDPNRFRIITSDFKYSDQRGYPCVDALVVVEDKDPQTSSKVKGALLLQSKSLYCRHPVRQETGFGIIYSYRGQSMYANLDSEAESFIDGVQVPVK